VTRFQIFSPPVSLAWISTSSYWICPFACNSKIRDDEPTTGRVASFLPLRPTAQDAWPGLAGAQDGRRPADETAAQTSSSLNGRIPHPPTPCGRPRRTRFSRTRNAVIQELVAPSSKNPPPGRAIFHPRCRLATPSPWRSPDARRPRLLRRALGTPVLRREPRRRGVPPRAASPPSPFSTTPAHYRDPALRTCRQPHLCHGAAVVHGVFLHGSPCPRLPSD